METAKNEDGARMEDYTTEMIKDMAFSFCPQCGAAIVPNHRGRPRKFCSPEYRSKWNDIHPRPQNWKTVRSIVHSRIRCCGRLKMWVLKQKEETK